MEKLKTNLVPVPLGKVRVTDPYCVNAKEKEAEYLQSLQVGRLLAGFYENAGLKTPYLRYGGWESGLMGGHTLGHFLTALSQGAVNLTFSPEIRNRFREKAIIILDSLTECQLSSRGKKGFLWGAPSKGNVEEQFDNVEKGRTDMRTQAWVPWYTMHKILSGIVTAYERLEYAPALRLACGLGDWVCERVLSYSEETRKQVLSVEYGGMNDVLYELFSLTGEEKYARAAHFFDEEDLFDRILTEGEDVLNDLHANTTIPKILGAMNRYLTLHGKTIDGKTADESRYLAVAESFFRMVCERHTYVTGGHSEWERFGRDYVLDAERTACNCETCNVANMLKLANALFCVTGNKSVADYADKAFLNQILSSQNPETGMTTYFQAMGSGYFKVFSTAYDSFWCCTGTGMENFTKLGDGIYYRNGKSLFVERYLSSELFDEDFSISQTCDFPMNPQAKFRVLSAKEAFFLCFRIPDWAAGEIKAEKNGSPVRLLEGNGHVLLAVREGDEISLTIPVEIRLQGLPDGKNAFAFCYGGAVLSADLGSEDMLETFTGAEVAIPASARGNDCVKFANLYDLFESPEKYLIREGDGFRLIGSDRELSLGLHYKRYRERYAVYLRLTEE